MGTESEADPKIEWLKCSKSPGYFIDTYCCIYDATESDWIPFKLWPEQFAIVQALEEYNLNVILKARQLGLTWLVLSYILWRMLFRPAFTALIFSRREVEAIYLLSENRLRGIYKRLPSWAQVREVVTDSSHTWQLSNGSVCYGFPTTAGDSYTAGMAFVDEADLVPDLDDLFEAVKPTIDGGGKMVLLSRVDKNTPGSAFKRIYIAARAGKSPWHASFLPWSTRPGRDKAWYERQKSDIYSRTGNLDSLYQQYPATDEEALKPPTADRRLPFEWIQKQYKPMDPIPEEEVEVGLPFLKVYVRPSLTGRYVIGADPAEGNPTSDDSVAHILDAYSGEECAVMAGPIEPSMFAEYLDTLARWYNHAEIMPERNNHGHAVILALRDIYNQDVVYGHDGGLGWMSSSKGKAMMYTNVAEALRDGEAIIHNQDTVNQLASIEGSTLRAPEGLHDDYASSFGIAICCKKTGGAEAEVGDNPTEGYRG